MDNLTMFKELFALHGALDLRESHKIGQRDRGDFCEADRLRVVPLVFGLMPSSAITRTSIATSIKPDIKRHLSSININHNDKELVEIIKNISDQFFNSKLILNTKQDKFSLAKIKSAYQGIYKNIRERQQDRCAVCGVEFDENPQDLQDREELDHCLPFNLVGDTPDGSNWQLLCKRCNNAKKDLISSLQHPEALNWIYTRNKDILTQVKSEPSPESRYIVLAQKGYCEEIGCHARPHEDQLFVIQKSQTGLAVIDNLGVYCKKHSRQYKVQG